MAMRGTRPIENRTRLGIESTGSATLGVSHTFRLSNTFPIGNSLRCLASTSSGAMVSEGADTAVLRPSIAKQGEG